MTKRGAYGQRLGNIFQLKRTPAFVTRALRKSTIAVTHIQCDRAHNGLTEPIPREEAFLVTLQLRDCPRHDLWIDDRAMRSGHLKAGAVSIYDLRLNPIVNSVSPFHSLHFYLPRAALNTIADMEGWAHVETFNNDPGRGVEDPVLHGLGRALLPSFERRTQANQLFVDHITLATAAHVLCNHGANTRPVQHFAGKLAPWQENRIKEILASQFDGDLSVSYLAQQCRLSISAFCHAFRLTTGMAPYQWLSRYRVDRAKALLRSRRQLSIRDIASACGFASRSHFVRTFKRITSSLPEDWRRG